MHAGYSSNAQNPRLNVHPLEVLRLKDEELLYVRMLSHQYGGLFTHYVGKGKNGRSQYCPGSNCPWPEHRRAPIWKGYIAAEKYLQDVNRWRPVCFEVSENLDCQMKSLYQRGQVWEISKRMDAGKKVYALHGRLLEQSDPAKLPEPFELLTALQHLYRYQAIILDKANPIAPRLLLEDSPGPERLEKKTAAADQADAKAQPPRLKIAERFKMPAESANGKQVETH